VLSRITTIPTELQLLRHEGASTASQLDVVKKELEAERAHSATLSTQLQEAVERVDALVSVDKASGSTASRTDEVRAQALSRTVSRLQAELGFERQQAAALRKAMDAHHQQLAELNKLLTTVERETSAKPGASAATPLVSEIPVDDLLSPAVQRIQDICRNIEAKSGITRVDPVDINEKLIWEARRDSIVLCAALVSLLIIAIGAILTFA
jgi:hypothetical protein